MAPLEVPQRLTDVHTELVETPTGPQEVLITWNLEEAQVKSTETVPVVMHEVTSVKIFFREAEVEKEWIEVPKEAAPTDR